MVLSIINDYLSVDGDELNQIALTLPEVEVMFAGFNPRNMLINRTDESIKIDVSALENISLAIFSDR